MKYACVRFVAAFAMFTTIGVCHAEEVKELSIEAEVMKSGDLIVEELIVVDLGYEKLKHGIERALPTRFGKNIATVRIEQVSNAFGNVPYTETNTADQKRLRIGDPKRTVNGTNTYRIQYLLLGAGASTPEGLKTTWSPNGKYWKLPIKLMKVLIRDQNGNRLVVSNPVPRGSLKIDSGETRIVVTNISPSEAISITITAPAAVASVVTTSAVAGQLGRDDDLLKIGLVLLGGGGLGFAAWKIKNSCRCNCGRSCRCACGCSASCECVALSRVATRTVGTTGAYGSGSSYDEHYYGHYDRQDHASNNVVSFDAGSSGSDSGGSSDVGADTDFGADGDSGGGDTW